MMYATTDAPAIIVLIESYWNLKITDGQRKEVHELVLIESYWNLKGTEDYRTRKNDRY